MSGMTYPSGRALRYAFDALGRVASITTVANEESRTVVENVAYHPFGGVKKFTLGNGQTYERSYDRDGRVSTYALAAQSFAIGYDAASRIEFISEIGNPANSNTYGYDSLDRLTQAVMPGTPFAYSYDPIGNRTAKTVGSSTDTYVYSASSNRIAAIMPGSGPPRNFVFDANGSTTDDTANTIGATTYQLNALGQRIRKTNSLADTVFHYDARGRLIAETDAAGGFKREVIYLGDIPVGVVQ